MFLIKEGIESLESLLTEKIEIETVGSAKDKFAGIYSGGKELAKGDAEHGLKAQILLSDLSKGIIATGENAAAGVKQEEATRPKLKQDGKGAAAKDSIIKPFGDNIKALITKIKS